MRDLKGGISNHFQIYFSHYDYHDYNMVILCHKEYKMTSRSIGYVYIM